MQELRGSPLLYVTSTTFGRKILEELSQAGDCRTILFIPDIGGRSIVPDSESFDDVIYESELVQRLFPHLQSLLPEDYLLGNSESVAWLPAPIAGEPSSKPDMFFCHRACFKSVDVPEENVPYRGKPAHRLLFPAVSLGDCKLELSHQAFGELVHHMQLLAACTKANVRGFVIDKTHIRMLEIASTSTVIRHAFCSLREVFLRRHSPWLRGLSNDFRFCLPFSKQPGSREFFQAFFNRPECDFVIALRHFCAHFQVTVDFDSFLGAGSTGMVWQVESMAAPVSRLALKIAASQVSARTLKQEHEIYSQYRCLFLSSNGTNMDVET